MALFETREYHERISKTKARMDEAGIEILVVADPANMNYLTGYDGWSFYVPQVVVVAMAAAEPVWVGRGMDVNGARQTTFLQPENIVGYPDHYVQTPVRHPMNFVADEIKRRNWDGKTIGLEMDAYYFSARGYVELQKSLPDDKFADSNLLVSWVRIVKSPQEIAYMQQAAKLPNG